MSGCTYRGPGRSCAETVTTCTANIDPIGCYPQSWDEDLCNSHAFERFQEGHEVFGPSGERVYRFDDNLNPIELLS